MDIFKNVEKFVNGIAEYNWFDPITIILLAFLASFLSRRIIDFAFEIRKKTKKIKRSEERLKRNETISKIAKTAVDIVIWMTAAMNFLGLIGVNVASLMTGAGLLGVVIGLGAQTTTRDVLAGFFIVGENQYRVGDTIDIMVGGRLISGKVEIFLYELRRFVMLTEKFIQFEMEQVKLLRIFRLSMRMLIYFLAFRMILILMFWKK